LGSTRFFDIFSMAGLYNMPVQYVRESGHKSGVGRGSVTLSDYMWREQQHQEEKEIFSQVWEKSAAVDSAEPNSKRILTCRRQDFADASILLTPTFCRRQHFVDANILSTRVFCQRQHFVHTIICQHQYFVNASILSSPTFCRRLCFCICMYFAGANNLPAPTFLYVLIFCRRQYFRFCLG
jgi:hypothetical protein